MSDSTTKRLLILNFLTSKAPSRNFFNFDHIKIEWIEYPIGWDFDLAVKLIEKWDGEVDAIALVGVQRAVGVRGAEFPHPGYLRLLRAAVKTPLYSPDATRDLFAEQALSEAISKEPELFWKKKALVHVASASPFLAPIENAGAELTVADLWTLLRWPLSLRGLQALEKPIQLIQPILRRHIHQFISGKVPLQPYRKEKISSPLTEWIQESDLFVTFYSLIRQFPGFDTNDPIPTEGPLAALAGKTLMIDYLPQGWATRAQQLGIRKLIEFAPQDGESPVQPRLHDVYFAAIHAALDMLRSEATPEVDFKQFAKTWLVSHNIRPIGLRVLGEEPKKAKVLVYQTDESRQRLFSLSPARMGYRLPGSENREKRHLSIRSAKTEQRIELELQDLRATRNELAQLPLETALQLTGRLVKECERDATQLLVLAHPFARRIGSSEAINKLIGHESPVNIEDNARLSLAAAVTTGLRAISSDGNIVLWGADKRLGQTIKALVELVSTQADLRRETGKLLATSSSSSPFSSPSSSSSPKPVRQANQGPRLKLDLHSTPKIDLLILAKPLPPELSLQEVLCRMTPTSKTLDLVGALSIANQGHQREPLLSSSRLRSKGGHESRLNRDELRFLRQSILPPPQFDLWAGVEAFQKVKEDPDRSNRASKASKSDTPLAKGQEPRVVEAEVAYAAFLGFEGSSDRDLLRGASPQDEAKALLEMLSKLESHGIKLHLPKAKSTSEVENKLAVAQPGKNHAGNGPRSLKVDAMPDLRQADRPQVF